MMKEVVRVDQSIITLSVLIFDNKLGEKLTPMRFSDKKFSNS